MDTQKKQEICDLLDRIGTIVVCSLGSEGYPNAKGMLKLEHDGLDKFYFSTNTSSRRARQFMTQHKACIYFFDPETFHGVMLTGDMAVRTDRLARERLWRKGFEMYYPAGIDDGDYCVLEFTSLSGNFYHGLANCDFNPAEVTEWMKNYSGSPDVRDVRLHETMVQSGFLD